MPRKFRMSVFNQFVLVLLWALSIFLTASALAAQSSNQYALLRKPTVSKTQIAFSYGGDLWIVDRTGGEARRLTSDVGIEIDPVLVELVMRHVANVSNIDHETFSKIPLDTEAPVISGR